MKIGNTELKHGLMLAPLAGFTNAVFRDICAESGSEYTVSEMISAKAVCYNDKKTLVLAKNTSKTPMALQLFGSEGEFIYKAIKTLTSEQYLSESGSTLPCAIDINMGCPVHKIVSNGEGSALMRDKARAAEVVRAAVEASSLPVTVKIRSGFAKADRNAVDFALALEDAGAVAVCVHGRSREQMYSGEVDLDIIKEVKEALSISVIGNGDIRCGRDALHMLEYTGCDALMIGRGAVGNPWIFSEIAAAIEGREYTKPTREEIFRTAEKHVLGLCELLGERRAVGEARKAVCAYFADFPGAAAARAEINEAKTAIEMCLVLKRVLLHT